VSINFQYFLPERINPFLAQIFQADAALIASHGRMRKDSNIEIQRLVGT
jgi:hypothetical protein